MNESRFSVEPEQFLFSSLLSGAVASAAVALLFLVIDAARGDLLFTPSLMGSVLLLDVRPLEVSAVRLDMVALYSLIHFVAFATLGALASSAYLREPVFRRQPMLLAGFVLAALGIGAVLVDALVFPGLVRAVGPAAVTGANVAAASMMAWFIHSSLADAGRPVPADARARPRGG